MQVQNSSLLSVKNLSLDLMTEAGRYPLIRKISFDVKEGQVLGIVGESGSGKTVTCLSLTRLLPEPPILYREGQVVFDGVDLWRLSEKELRSVRTAGISIIFQDALNALNPVIKVGKQVSEVLQAQQDISRTEAYRQTVALFQQVGIPLPEVRYHHFPHQLSGGLQQRVMIAMAIAGNPRLLIADEPTTALDVTIQVQIIELLKDLGRKKGMSIIFINHDLGLIAEMCDEVLVMYGGEIVEYAPVNRLFENPVHPYTRLLMESIPRLDISRGKLKQIPGQPPAPEQYPTGCKFHPRCPFADEKCQRESPPKFSIAPNHYHRCWHPSIPE
ncbi:MAG: ABC transporter ATP-binding protein [Calditrichia bacterium]